MKKGKSQIGINKANNTTFSGWIHLRLLHLPAGIFLNCFSALKQLQIPIGKYSVHVRMLQMSSLGLLA